MKQQTNKNTEYNGLDELLNTEVMKNYNSFIVSMAMKYAPEAKIAVDFGAVIGTMSQIFKFKFFIKPICIEIDNTNKGYLKKRGFKTYDSFPSDAMLIVHLK